MRLQAIPTKKLPNTSHPTPEIAECRKLSIVRSNKNKLNTPKLYKSLNELHTRALKLKLTGWTINKAESNVSLSYSEPLFHLPKYKIIIDDDLGFTVIAYGYSLRDDHVLYKKYIQFMGNVTVSNLIYDLQKYFLCGGCTVSSEKFMNHIVRCKTDVNKLDTSPLNFKQCRRSSLCEVLMTEKCANFDKFEEKHKRLVTKQQKNLNVPAKLKAPVSKAHPSRLRPALQNERLKCPLLEKELATMKNEIESKAVSLPSDISSFTTVGFNPKVIENLQFNKRFQ